MARRECRHGATVTEKAPVRKDDEVGEPLTAAVGRTPAEGRAAAVREAGTSAQTALISPSNALPLKRNTWFARALFGAK